MVYGIGVLGFVLGFIFGQMVLYFLLRHKSKKELVEDDSLKWTYGLLNWVFAGIGSYLFVSQYNYYMTLVVP